MKICIQMKSIGKRKHNLTPVSVEISENPATVRDFLVMLVKTEVEKYESRQRESDIFKALTTQEVEDQAVSGKVGFEKIYSKKQPELAKAIENACQCYADGLVRIFQNEEELPSLDQAMEIREGDVFTLVRMTFLSGRLW